MVGMRGKKEYQVYWDDTRGLWVLESKSGDRAVKTDKTKSSVVSKARSVARNNDARLTILNKRGGLSEQNAYDV